MAPRGKLGTETRAAGMTCENEVKVKMTCPQTKDPGVPDFRTVSESTSVVQGAQSAALSHDGPSRRIQEIVT